MYENKETLVLTTEQIVKGLRCCATGTNAGGGCRNCPLEPVRRKIECAELINLMAADRIGELQEENRRLRDATEVICRKQGQELARLAGEANTALDRGLVGVNEDHFAAMLECQNVLSELGRETVIRAEPAGGEKGWRILGVRVEGVTVFGSMEQAGDDGGGQGG